MLSLSRKKIVFDAGRCRQCGSCLAACPHGALSAVMADRQYRIVCDPAKCVGCGRCVKVCQESYLTGQAACGMAELAAAPEIRLAWHRDGAVRKFAASGGVTRAVIRGVLQNRLCDAVYCLTYQPDGEPAGGYLTSYPADESVIPCSLYRPVMWGRNLEQADKAWRRILLVGLPCQIRSAKVFLQRQSPQLDVLAVTIFCKKQKEFGYSRYIARELGASAREWPRVIYRGDGWPGAMRLRGAAAPRVSYRYPALCWNLSGCRGCFDSLNAANSDLTVTDPWEIVAVEPGEPGQNLVMAWSETGVEWLHSLPDLVLGPSVRPEDAAKSLPLAAVHQKRLDWQRLPFFSRANLIKLKQLAKRILGEFYLLHRPVGSGRQQNQK